MALVRGHKFVLVAWLMSHCPLIAYVREGTLRAKNRFVYTTRRRSPDASKQPGFDVCRLFQRAGVHYFWSVND